MSQAPFRLTPLDAAHDRAAFCCEAESLNRYLCKQASQDMRRRVAACFVALADDRRIAGYYTLASASLVLADLRLRDAHRVPLWESPAWQAHGSGLAVMALSMAPSDDEGLAVLQAGACGYGHALLPATHLHQALEIIEKGQLWVGRALLARLLHRVDERLRPTSPPAWRSTWRRNCAPR